MTNFENEIRRKGYIAFPNEGDSMMPLLRQHRDIMVIRKITEPLKKGDVVLFKRPNGAYVLHRIVKVFGLGRYRIAGDNRAFSEIVPEEWIVGILAEVIKDDHRITADSDEYKAYAKKASRRRLKLKAVGGAYAIKRKFCNLFRRNKP